MVGSQHAVLNLFFYITPGSAQATYTTGGDAVSSATGNPTKIQIAAADGSVASGTIPMPGVTARIKIAVCISANTTFIIRQNAQDTLVNGGTPLTIAARYVFEDIWTPGTYGTGANAQISFRFGANCTVYHFAATWQAV